MKIKLNSKIYPLEVILNACHAFIDRAYIFLDSNGKAGNIIVSLKGKSRLSAGRLDCLHGDFMNELLNCALRYSVSKENKKIREYIILRALCASMPAQNPESNSEKLDYQQDPLGIAVPWEEKYGKKKKHAKVKV